MNPSTSFRKPFLISAGLAFGAAAAHGAIIASESFQATAAGTGGTYDADTNLAVAPNNAIVVGNSGFVNSTGKLWGVATTAGVVSNLAGLSHNFVAGTPQSGAVRIGNISGGIARDNYRLFANTIPDSSSYYFSGLVNIASFSNMVGVTQTLAGVTSTSGSPQDTFTISTGFHYGLSRDSLGNIRLVAAAGNAFYNLFTLPSAGTTYQVVLKLDVSTTGNESLSAWYAPDGATELSVSLTAVDVGNIYTGTSSLGGILLQVRNQGGGSNAGKTNLFDELRFGTALSDVTTASIPEPASVALASGGLAATLIGLGRRRRRS